MGAPRLRDEQDPYEELFTKEDREIIYDRPHRKRKEDVAKDPSEDNIQDMRRRWKNRRRMAWLSLFAMFAMTYFVFFTDLVDVERMKVLKEPLTWFYFACISVVGAYMGFTTWASKK